MSNLSISKIGTESEAVLRNLFQHYLPEMAEWFDVEAEPDGSYAYDFSSIWKNYGVYVAKIDNTHAGFALVGSAAEWLEDSCAHDVHEFFVVREFRREHVGQRMAEFLWDQYPGEWLVRVLEANTPAMLFWRKTIASYARAIFTEEARVANGRPWRFFRFVAK